MAHTFIIAEAGVNHNGSLKTAKKMIDVAVSAGADAVKFQTFTAESLASRYAPKAEYQMRLTGKKESQFDMLKKLELSHAAHKELLGYCRKKGIIFMSSPFDTESVDFLNRLGVKILKIPSGEITNFPYLRKIGTLKKKLILSTGMSDLKEVKRALGILILSGTKRENITVLHCTTEYPAPMDSVNLRAMLTMKGKLKVKVGYSDHTAGVEVAIAAVALGAEVIEKHFTLDKTMAGPDHKASLNPDELKSLIKAARNIEIALGDAIKRPSEIEEKNKNAVRKSVVANTYIPAKAVIKRQMLGVKRPGYGISPKYFENIVGMTAKRDIKEGELIDYSMVIS